MLLGTHGSCTTVSQFALSFAGALTTAITDIVQENTEFALVGLIQERDARLEKTLSTVAQNSAHDDFAFFLLLGPSTHSCRITVSWENISGEIKNKFIDNIFFDTIDIFRLFRSGIPFCHQVTDYHSRSSCCISYTP